MNVFFKRLIQAGEFFNPYAQLKLLKWRKALMGMSMSKIQQKRMTKIDRTLLQQLRENAASLKTLDLSSQASTEDDILELTAALKNNTFLTKLNVSENKISARGAEALAKNTTLTQLNISDNKIGPKGAEVLAKNTTLTHLDINDNAIGDEGMQALAKNTILTQLIVKFNKIGDEGAQALVKNITLIELNAGNNQISDKIKELIKNRIQLNRHVQGKSKEIERHFKSACFFTFGFLSIPSPDKKETESRFAINIRYH